MLELQNALYDSKQKYMSGYDMINMLPHIKAKQETSWLNEISSTSLCRICNELDKRFQLFFHKKVCHPRFKSKKRSSISYPVRCDRNFFRENQIVHIEKVGNLKYKSDFDFLNMRIHKITRASISICGGKFYLSFGIECESQAPKLTDKSMGIDLGIKELAVASCGNEQFIFHNINKSKKVRELKRKLKHTKRTISRKYEASKARTGNYEKTKNIEREEEKLRKIYARLNGIRHNYLHQTTHKLVSMLPKRVIMEDLNVQGMMKNKHLSEAIAEQCFYEFIRQMKYKCEWNGIEFIQVSRFYPSSKTCSCCGSIKRNLKLGDRTYVCPDCGFTIDRDLNAAINLMRYENLPTQVSA